jgi:hypothetical protein
MLRYVFVILLTIFLSHTSMVFAQVFKRDGSFKLEVKDLKGTLKVSVNLAFTDKVANSCIGGDWKEITIATIDSIDESYFLIKQELSYLVTDQRLIIGRNGRCDSYLHLNGLLAPNDISGDYTAFGLDHQKLLGHFTINRVKQ